MHGAMNVIVKDRLLRSLNLLQKEKDLEYGSLKKLFHHGNGEKIGNDNK